ncbi:hypothetical protein M513_11294 [Trichuris suis]|uniref:Uncharacterized protein n=1 Tax=Trichuris suis TaxID=68888 RepID=A0A085LS68_9BILA|nr:hypothetical protein M513_11294 [Trichuris suis]
MSDAGAEELCRANTSEREVGGAGAKKVEKLSDEGAEELCRANTSERESFVCTNKQSIKERKGLICFFFHGKNNLVWSFVCTNKQSIKEGEGLICLFFHGKNNLVRISSTLWSP